MTHSLTIFIRSYQKTEAKAACPGKHANALLSQITALFYFDSVELISSILNCKVEKRKMKQLKILETVLHQKRPHRSFFKHIIMTYVVVLKTPDL